MSSNKIALVIEGGGFKSVFSAGVLDAFIINNFNPFDIYIGVSSGAMALSYYLSNRYKAYFSVSKKVCVSSEFLSYKHAFSEEGYMNLNYLLKYAIKKYPLDYVKIKKTIKNKQFYIVATNTENGSAVYLNPNKDNIYKCLKATSSLPFFTKGVCRLNGVNLMDGAWSDPIPVKSAINFGANQIIVIRPHPVGYKLDGLNYLGLLAGYWWSDNPNKSQLFFEEYNNYNKSVDFLVNNASGIEITQICPDNILKSTVLGTGHKDLLDDYHCGLESGMDFINNYAQKLQ